MSETPVAGVSVADGAAGPAPMTTAMSRPVHALFVATILAGSFLLFLVQPMVARMALPRLGGAPAVWNSAMLVYQALLLGGYAYAHGLARFRPRVQAGIHLGLLAIAALWLPIGLVAGDPPADADPAVWVPWLLGLSIGPLFFAVSAQAPLIQRWFAAASGGRDPYALYAASNLGSFGGLIALMESTIDGLEPVNLGNPEELTVSELLEEVIGLVGSDVTVTHLPLPIDDPRRRHRRQSSGSSRPRTRTRW